MDCCHGHGHCKSDALTRAEAFCAERNLRFTESRRKVFDVLWQSHHAMTAHDIMQALGNNQPPVTYRALEFLQENGLIHSIPSLNAYVGCHFVGEHHTGQMMVCRDCKHVTEIDLALPKLDSIAAANGFKIDHMHIEVLGQCRECQTRAG
ncbi:MAG: Fur family transcriptional regulator [Pseudomonas fluorescens]|nr:MAG: Fur family transcriptional regulator [Pseudomonas fluorescens]